MENDTGGTLGAQPDPVIGGDLLPAGTFPRHLIDAVPSMVFVLDGTAHILEANRAAVDLLGDRDSLVLRRLCGDVLFCVHARELQDGCGSTTSCALCQVRQGAAAVIAGETLHRKLHQMRLAIDGQERDFAFLVTASPFEHAGRRFAMLVLEDVTELTALREIVPICSHCKKIRNDEKYWESVEAFLAPRLGLIFSHSVCPDCLTTHYPDVDTTS
jgi:hypothetical protein